MRLMNKGHCTCGLILSIFGQMRSTIYQNVCVRIWPLLVSLTKCAALQMRPQLAKCARTVRILAKRCAFGQMPRVRQWSDAQRICPCADWSNASYITTLRAPFVYQVLTFKFVRLSVRKILRI